MAYVARKTEKGIAKASNGWIAAEVETAQDDSAMEREVIRRKLLAGPFQGVGAKVRAIEAAGTNRVVPA